jgi:NAD+ diphosphatase
VQTAFNNPALGLVYAGRFSLDSAAYFFQGNSLLLPDTVSDSQMDKEIPLSFEKQFIYKEIVEIPAMDCSAGTIVCVSIDRKSPLPPNWRAVPVRQGLSFISSGIIEGAGSTGRLLRAFHISQWWRESLFCGSCGSKNTGVPNELARLCPACGRLEYPRISPAVITLITNDEEKALLAHNKKFTPGVYSLIAGFNEAGENLEATVAREIREEVNIEVTDIRYIASQPWPFPNSLMLAFSARYASGTVRPDGIEIEDAQWFSKDGLPQLPGQGSVSRYLINRWLEGSL